MALESRDELDVQALADLAGLSRAHFSRVFKTCEGVPPAEFVLAERMRRAASLLVSGASSVKTVARDCGFDDPNYFAKAFRRRFGASPTEFRTTGMYRSARRDWKVDDAHESARTRRREQIALVRSEWRREARGAPIYVRGI